MNNLKQIRTIKEAISEIKSIDPSTPITEHWLRSMCRKKNCPFSEMVFGKYLIDMEKLIEYINGLVDKAA